MPRVVLAAGGFSVSVFPAREANQSSILYCILQPLGAAHFFLARPVGIHSLGYVHMMEHGEWNVCNMHMHVSGHICIMLSVEYQICIYIHDISDIRTPRSNGLRNHFTLHTHTQPPPDNHADNVIAYCVDLMHFEM